MSSNNTYIELISELSVQSRGPNKYLNWYLSIIERAQNRILTEYTEKHHIVPDCFYINRKRKGRKGFLEGTGEHKNNFVNLTCEEHLIAHLLLIKMFNVNFSKYKFLLKASILMTSNKQLNNKNYGWVKRKISTNFSGENNPNYNKRFINNKEYNLMIDKNLPLPNGWDEGRKPYKEPKIKPIKEPKVKPIKEPKIKPVLNKKKQWITNGIEHKYISVDIKIPNGWRKGKISTKKKTLIKYTKKRNNLK